MKLQLNDDYKIVHESPNDGFSYFIGYYDIDPINRSRTKMLAHRVKFDGKPVGEGDYADVGYFDLNSMEYFKIGETLAWNWQQGSRLQWMPPYFEDEIIYNDILDDRFISIRYNTKTKERTSIPFPIYVIHPNGKESITVNYERLYWCREGYNYQNIRNKKWDVPIHPEDGIFRIDLSNKKIERIVSTEQIAGLEKFNKLPHESHWLEHMMYSPVGDRFLFFHRWKKDGKVQSQFFTCGADGKDLIKFPNTLFYSHYDWVDENQLIVWTLPPKAAIKRNRLKTRIKRSVFSLVRPYYQRIKNKIPSTLKDQISLPRSGLYRFEDKSLAHELVGKGILSGNGHTTYVKDLNLLLNDTYQDEQGYRYLQLFDLMNNRLITVGKFFSNYNKTIYRCDLHPRISHDNSLIVIDSCHLENRKVLVISRKNNEKNSKIHF